MIYSSRFTILEHLITVNSLHHTPYVLYRTPYAVSRTPYAQRLTPNAFQLFNFSTFQLIPEKTYL